jgi:hypothetical protein
VGRGIIDGLKNRHEQGEERFMKKNSVLLLITILFGQSAKNSRQNKRTEKGSQKKHICRRELAFTMSVVTRALRCDRSWQRVAKRR